MKLFAAFAASLALIASAHGQEPYPTKKPISLVSPFPAGGGSDVLTRVFAESMRKSLGQQVIVLNVGGAGGTIGARQVAQAAPDGYTLLLHHIGHSTARALYKDLPFDPVASFEPIALVAEAPKLMLSGKTFPPNNVTELVAHIKKNPSKINFATAGVGSAGHLCAMLFEEAIGEKLTQIQYKGGGPAAIDVMSGQADLFCEIPPPMIPHINAGTMKVFVMAGDKRLPQLPNVPTSAEAGLKRWSMSVWYGLYAPAGTPKPIVDRLAQAIQDAMKDPEVIAQVDKLGTVLFEPSQANPAALRQHLQSQIDLWTPIIQRAGVSGN